MQSVCIFCGSNPGKSPVYAEAARAVVRAAAAAGMKIVFGGGKVGLMGVVADTALAAGAHVIGVTPRRLLEQEVVHTGLSELHVVDSMHERKVMMAKLSDAFIALPGGMGTLDEIFEMLTLTQLGMQRKPSGFFNVDGFFDHLLGFLDHATAERFIRTQHRDMIIAESDPAQLITRLQSWSAPDVSKWQDRSTG